MRRPVIAGNWKMHMTCAQSREFMEVFLPLIADTPDDRDLVLAPPFTALSTICLLYTSPSPRDKRQSRMPSSA